MIKKTISITRQHSNYSFEDENFISILTRGDKDTISAGQITEFDNEYKDDLENMVNEFDDIYEDLNKYLLPYINNEEVILTWGFSETILQCFASASKEGKKLIVLVVNNNLKNDGGEMVKKLREESIESYLVEDSSLCTIMHKVNKVVLNCNSLLADGGILGYSGMLAMAMVAKNHSVP